MSSSWRQVNWRVARLTSSHAFKYFWRLNVSCSFFHNSHFFKSRARICLGTIHFDLFSIVRLFGKDSNNEVVTIVMRLLTYSSGCRFVQKILRQLAVASLWAAKVRLAWSKFMRVSCVIHVEVFLFMVTYKSIIKWLDVTSGEQHEHAIKL